MCISLYFDSLTLFMMQTIIFEVKSLILHQFIELKASGRGSSPYTGQYESSDWYHLHINQKIIVQVPQF